MFASKSLVEHLFHGAVGLSAFAFSAVLGPDHPWIALALVPGALVAPGEACGTSSHQACAVGPCDAPTLTAEGRCPALIEDGKSCGATAVGTCDYLARCLGGVCVRQGGETCR